MPIVRRMWRSRHKSDRQRCRQAERGWLSKRCFTRTELAQISRGTLAFNNLWALSRAIEVMGSIRSSISTEFGSAERCLSRRDCWMPCRCARQAFRKGEDALDRFAVMVRPIGLFRADITERRVQLEGFVGRPADKVVSGKPMRVETCGLPAMMRPAESRARRPSSARSALAAPPERCNKMRRRCMWPKYTTFDAAGRAGDNVLHQPIGTSIVATRGRQIENALYRIGVPHGSGNTGQRPDCRAIMLISCDNDGLSQPKAGPNAVRALLLF